MQQTINIVIKIIKDWQTLIGSTIGAMSPFILWWIAENIRKKRDYNKNLYYVEKLLVDQINNIIETRKTIRDFIDQKLNTLIIKILNNNKDAFSIDYAFFPLFSTIPLNDEILKINTKSGYIDNKIAKSYQLSRDMPFIINDVRQQFFSTIQLNRDLSLNKINSPEIQKETYVNNIKEYILMLERDLLGINIPIYLKILTETREALNELRKIGLLGWSLKFDPKYHFFKNKKRYIEAKENTYDKIGGYFEKNVKKGLLKIDKM